MKENFFCIECHFKSVQWMGMCPSCKKWNTLEDLSLPTSKMGHTPIVYKLADYKVKKREVIETGDEQLDKAFGKGLVRGMIFLIGGKPGVGKSTFVAMICKKVLSKNKENLIYVSGEEGTDQLAERFNRIGINQGNFFISMEKNIRNLQSQIELLNPCLVVIDSIQTIYTSDDPKEISQKASMVEVIEYLIEYLKEKGITCILIGHVTKTGRLAGPSYLEHMVDGVGYLEGESAHTLRTFRMAKNRFGSCHQLVQFNMTEQGF